MEADTPGTTPTEPWWMRDPQIQAISRGVLEEIENAPDRTAGPDEADRIVNDVLGGSSRRELAAARDALADARVRYAAAVRSAREVGFSWAEIGRVLGVPKQLVHRRFRDTCV